MKTFANGRWVGLLIGDFRSDFKVDKLVKSVLRMHQRWMEGKNGYQIESDAGYDQLSHQQAQLPRTR
jgi:hypothetical protein